ncbi:EAL domain-containing protein [Sulfurimonas sp.]|nr:EAL domain-containing protein [Sulfurimonas sp.]
MDFKDLENINILYVEDEDIIRDNITDMLQDICQEIFTANNGEEGYKLFIEKEEHIHLIISDIQMPILSGLEMAKKIREVTYDVPIIFTTAFSDSKYLFESINIGVDAYVEKPIDIMQLLQTTKKTILPFAQRKALLEQAYIDKLTGLKNRSALDLQLEKNVHSGLFLLDIHAFKVINDLYGTNMGNFVLKEFAHFLTHQKIDNWDIYRVGSDDFAFLVYNYMDKEYCDSFFETFFENLRQFHIYNHDYDIEIKISITVGVSLEPENVLETADMALKTAKKEKREYLLYQECHNCAQTYENDIKWINKIDLAIKTDNIKPYFQPIVNKNKEIIKFECLMRLCEKEKANSPYFFLDIAKKSRIYKTLTMIMLKQIFEAISQHQNYDFSINMSQIDILDSTIVNYILANLSERNIGTRVIFEILEDESLKDKEKFLDFVNYVKALGAKIAIDDFGAGYSNFSYMLELNPDIIKIDGSLIKNIDTDRNSYIVTNAIINFTKQLKIETVAEYVHSEDVFTIAQELGIDNFQGFLFSEPVPENEIEKF